MEEAVAMLVEAVAQGHVGAMGVLAEVYEGGCGVDQDEEKAGELRRRAAAMGVLAEMYEGGCGVDRDEEKAAELRSKGEGV